MIALLQRVSEASVSVSNNKIASIDKGVLVLVGIERHDSEYQADRLINRILDYRIFDDADGKMNLSLKDTQGGLLLVPQFTLAADTQKGLRPSFSSAANPSDADKLFSYFCSQSKLAYSPVEVGQFGADMQVSLINDGPVTFNLTIPPKQDGLNS